MKKIVNQFIVCAFLTTFCTQATKKALITGITGQDGAYLAEFLINKGYEVHGIKRRSSTITTERIKHLCNDSDLRKSTLVLHEGDLCDFSNVMAIIKKVEPDEIYNLAAQSHVGVSFEVPQYTALVDALGPLNILEAIHKLELEKKTKFYQASTSELFGKIQEIPQKETTPFYPRSPYGVAKLYAYWICKNYKEAYGIFAVNGILFNHESPFRGSSFVTKKIAHAAVKIAKGLQSILYLGNLDAKRDWGHAKDYVEAMWLMLQQQEPDDFVIASGETHSVREFVELAFGHAGISIGWSGTGVDEIGYDLATGKTVVAIDSRYFRPTEVDYLLGDPSKAHTVLGWSPKISFKELVKEMVEYEMEYGYKENQ